MLLQQRQHQNTENQVLRGDFSLKCCKLCSSQTSKQTMERNVMKRKANLWIIDKLICNRGDPNNLLQTHKGSARCISKVPTHSVRMRHKSLKIVWKREKNTSHNKDMIYDTRTCLEPNTRFLDNAKLWIVPLSSRWWADVAQFCCALQHVFSVLCICVRKELWKC